MHVRAWLVVLATGLLACGAATSRGQEKTAKSAARGPVAAFDAQFVEWKKILAAMKKNTLEYRAAKPEERPKIIEQREEIRARGDVMEPKIRKAAEAAYLAEPNKNQEVTLFVESMADEASIRDRYEEALRLCQMLIDNGYEKKRVYSMAGRAAFYTGDLDAAEKYFKIAQEARALEPDPGERLYGSIADARQKWERENELRAAEEKADDLPRVRLRTSKGDIVIELFENEAPNTVANFINLVEKGFYNGTPFHRVIEQFMAQGGDPTGEGKGGPGYRIPCECYEDNHRMHFRGSLGMANLGRDTGGSQFYITFVPTSHLDGRHTVFGRVVEGMDVATNLQKRDPEKNTSVTPDKIIDATVQRKRNHKYEPKALSEN